MPLIQRMDDCWDWPKTILDYADFNHVPPEQLDEIMDATVALLGGRAVSAAIVVSPMYGGEPGEEVDELVLTAHLPQGELIGDRYLHSAWSREVHRIIWRTQHLPLRLVLLPAPDAPRETDTP